MVVLPFHKNINKSIKKDDFWTMSVSCLSFMWPPLNPNRSKYPFETATRVVPLKLNVRVWYEKKGYDLNCALLWQ